MNILDKITACKRKEISSRKQSIPAKSLEAYPAFKLSLASFRQSLINPFPSLIAEFKRKSPSKGFINADISLYEVITAYNKAGVQAISVLTDKEFFGGSLYDLQEASGLSVLPLLRKDFVIDEYQIIEAKAFGASAVLLIASILTAKEIIRFSNFTLALGMDVLFEVHNEKELDKWFPGINIVGVNNRNLSTFEVNIEHSVTLLEQIPGECIRVAESGISKPDTVKHLYNAGFNAFLIGEAFMRAKNPYEKAEQFISDLR